MSEHKDFNMCVKELEDAKKKFDYAYKIYFKGVPMDYDLNEIINGMKKYMDSMYEIVINYSQEEK